MKVERNRDAAHDIAYLIEVLDTVEDIWCVKYGGNCYNCPLGKLGVFNVRICRELARVKSRLELAYKVVETL